MVNVNTLKWHNNMVAFKSYENEQFAHDSLEEFFCFDFDVFNDFWSFGLCAFQGLPRP